MSEAQKHDANVFLPGCLGPVRRTVVLEEDYDQLRAELAALKAGQGEAVAWVIVVPGTTFKSVGFSVRLQDLPVGTELYAAPSALLAQSESTGVKL